MTNPAVVLSDTLPPNVGVRIGLAALDTDGVTLIVLVAGVKINCGFIRGVAITVGKPVAVLRNGPTWLCLGQVQVQP